MRRPAYLSPSAIDLYCKDKEAYFKRYLADCRQPRDPQTQAMAIGSAFDCYVKNWISDEVFGKGVREEFNLDRMFEVAVEAPVRDKARTDGLVVFDLYRRSGALADLMTTLNAASDIRMEFEVKGTVLIQRPGGVTLLGKPDLSFVTKSGRRMLLDWKVNGAYSSYNTSPMKGYLKCRSGSGVGSQPHKDCIIGVAEGGGIKYNALHTLENLNPVWAQQLSVYAWLCGSAVGDELLVCVDQIVGQLGAQRVAEHRLMVSGSWQSELALKIDEIWEIIHSDHFFRELSVSESQARCQLLEAQAVAAFGASEEENAEWAFLCDSGKTSYRG